MKRFVDANTLVSGLVFSGNEAILLELGRFGVCEFVTNGYVLEEVRDVLARPPGTVTANYSVTLLRPTPIGEVLHLTSRLVEHHADRAIVGTTLEAGKRLLHKMICMECQ